LFEHTDQAEVVKKGKGDYTIAKARKKLRKGDYNSKRFSGYHPLQEKFYRCCAISSEKCANCAITYLQQMSFLLGVLILMIMTLEQS